MSLDKFLFKPRSVKEADHLSILQEIIPDDKDFLKVMLFCARAFTGRVIIDDYNFLFIDGRGSNGKSTFTRIMSMAMPSIKYEHGSILKHLSSQNLAISEIGQTDFEDDVIPNYEELIHHTLKIRHLYSAEEYINNTCHHVVIGNKRRRYKIAKDTEIPEGTALYVTFPTKFISDVVEVLDEKTVRARSDIINYIEYDVVKNILRHYAYILNNEFDGSVRKAIKFIDSI